MPMNGVCDLELRQLIEGAFLPWRCEVTCSDRLALTIHLPANAEYAELTVTGVRLSALPDMRAIAELVGQIREERLTMGLTPAQSRRG